MGFVFNKCLNNNTYSITYINGVINMKFGVITVMTGTQ